MAVVQGTSGNDTLLGGETDSLRGLAGSDRLEAGPRPLLPDVGRFFEGGDGDDTIVGAAAAAVEGATETLSGGAGDDVIAIAGGIDGVLFGAFAIDGGDGSDILVYRPLGLGPGSVDLAEGTASLGGVRATLTGIESIFVSLGGLEADASLTSLTGVVQANRLVGSDADNIFVSEAQLVANGGGGNDTVLGSGYGDTVAGGSGDDVIFGRGGDDLILGNDGNDAFDGGNGDDVLEGGAGDDNLFGGPGADQYVFDYRKGEAIGTDGIFGFSRAEGDRIVLFGAPAEVRFQAGSGPAIFSAAGNSFLFLGKDAGGADQFAIVVGVTDLGAVDIVFA